MSSSPSTGGQVRECTQKHIPSKLVDRNGRSSIPHNGFPDQNEIGKCPIESASAWITTSPAYGRPQYVHIILLIQDMHVSFQESECCFAYAY